MSCSSDSKSRCISCDLLVHDLIHYSMSFTPTSSFNFDRIFHNFLFDSWINPIISDDVGPLVTTDFTRRLRIDPNDAAPVGTV